MTPPLSHLAEMMNRVVQEDIDRLRAYYDGETWSRECLYTRCEPDPRGAGFMIYSMPNRDLVPILVRTALTPAQVRDWYNWFVGQGCSPAEAIRGTEGVACSGSSS